ncbi:hypothetical protein ODZ84_09900 [Chryseobacterium fluminis]|uniref:hypothetical protein n=1 Tax=Chryseobacterium fluminis TaxID=2983606 RepID=UPI00224CA104|nr:hypothetical protein [Chryseobacterium sp. MMS21-Ot14]UZT99845.1 hypothetical protein ODZ84_09900 [Chryseobacterium sp. MMS21-Ot14]
MAKRVITKIGDIFAVPISTTEKRYMQLIAFDLTQLNSDVVRAFKKKYSINENPTLEEVIDDEILFYAHCVTKFGAKLELWEKIGNIEEVGNIKEIIFRGTSQFGRKEGEERILVSNKWYVWRINDDEVTRVNKLEGENRKSEIGLIVNPYDIVERMKTGNYSFFYPGFE